MAVSQSPRPVKFSEVVLSLGEVSKTTAVKNSKHKVLNPKQIQSTKNSKLQMQTQYSCSC
jgi:hypothetical protein